MSQTKSSIFRVVILYLSFSALWIYTTDQLAYFLETTFGVPKQIETLKGLLFVLASALLLFWLLYRELKRSEAVYQEHLFEKERLLEQLRFKNEELLDAYDRTILGWSHVLEMRNREVKDHSRRVTDMTLHLARYMGIPEADIIHIRRGALLHDIGKMAIADSVILKEGDLSEEERALIRRHPLFGFEMVSEIEFLRPAMDILLCHHEKWDGSGYPFGLSGEEIPLYARIFAIVDVWDAFTSDDRAYRKADPPEVAADYLRSQAGEHFDPAIVDTFLKMLVDQGVIDLKSEEESDPGESRLE